MVLATPTLLIKDFVDDLSALVDIRLTIVDIEATTTSMDLLESQA